MKNPAGAESAGKQTVRVLMLGDSITAGFDTARLLPSYSIVNRGVSGDSTEECRERIVPEWFTVPPELLFLCIGTNDLARDRNDAFILEGIRSIVQTIRRYAQPAIVLTSIFPTRDNAPRPNERIRGLNNGIAALASGSGCRYFDLHPHFADGTGSLKQEFTDDGLHLTDAAYHSWSGLLSDSIDSYSGSTYRGPAV
ncbi:MAG: hypothetical protein HUU02_11595 [Bacteroidetes bacterium]|nr:hypothetical protein [Bacteroidota bacterium]